MATDRREQNVVRVRRGIDAFNSGDAQAVLDFFDEDIEIYASPKLANSGTYRGHDGYQRWLAEWLDAWDDYALDVERVEPVGDHHVVVGVLQTARGKGSGIPVEMPTAYMFELSDEGTRAFHLYVTWDEAMAEAERRETEDAD